MDSQHEPQSSEEAGSLEPGLSRRRVLGLVASLAATPLLASSVDAAPLLVQRRGATPILTDSQPVDLVSAIPQPRYLHAAVGLRDGRVVVTGGYGVGESARARVAAAPTASVQVYDAARDLWRDLAPMRLPRARHAAVLLPDDRIVVLGGVHLGVVDSVEIYDPFADEWTDGPPLPLPIADHAASVCASGVLVTGGQASTPALLLSSLF